MAMAMAMMWHTVHVRMHASRADPCVRRAAQVHLCEPEGDILVFLTGEQEIEDACKKTKAEIENMGEQVGAHMAALPVLPVPVLPVPVLPVPVLPVPAQAAPAQAAPAQAAPAPGQVVWYIGSPFNRDGRRRMLSGPVGV